MSIQIEIVWELYESYMAAQSCLINNLQGKSPLVPKVMRKYPQNEHHQVLLLLQHPQSKKFEDISHKNLMKRLVPELRSLHSLFRRQINLLHFTKSIHLSIKSLGCDLSLSSNRKLIDFSVIRVVPLV